MDNLFQSQHYQSRIPADTPAPLKSAARKAISMIVIQSCSLRYAVKVAAGKHQVQEQTLLKLVSLCIPPSFYSQRAFQLGSPLRIESGKSKTLNSVPNKDRLDWHKFRNCATDLVCTNVISVAVSATLCG